ncbi:M56 family metallopeptidase [Caulobacter sp. 1776]|uniref:M56 family metallopeptidase n=1 Tax=Caulobacter sp. 1776 TaxID=3156420 RepID=UPI003399BDE1
MHPLLASTALGLVAAWPVGALGFGLGRLVERLTDDPRPRAAAWSLAYALPAGALAATVALTFSPVTAPKASPVAVPGPVRMVVADMADAPARPTAAAPAWTPSPILSNGLAWSLVGLSAAGLLTRGWRWNRGRRRLAAVRAAAEPCQDYALIESVRARAARLGVKAPRVRISAAIAEPLLAGVRRPVILLPKALAETAGAERLALVCGHELAHLRRGDNWRIPAEEALAGLFWLTPPVAALRGRMLAAREAVCDLTALDGAAPEARRDYARVLVEALRMNAQPAPRLAFESAFTGRDRSLVSLRLAAILQPRGAASWGRIGLAVALGGVLTTATGAGSLALADQARRLAPPHLAHVEADASPAVAPVTAEAARAISTQVAAAAEAKAAVAADAAALAAPVAEIAAQAEPAADAQPAEPARAMRTPDPQPDPRPDPRPDPHPNPQPNPRPSSAVEVIADMQKSIPSQRQMIFLGSVTVKGKLDPVQVNLQVNGLPAGAGFQPSDLKLGAIERLEVTDNRATTDGRIAVNVVLKSDRATPWDR